MKVYSFLLAGRGHLVCTNWRCWGLYCYK